MNIISDEVFIPRFDAVISDATAIVEEHTQDGENGRFMISQMFPRGVEDCMYEVYKKVCRAMGYYDKNNSKKAREELRDIINYAGFGIVLLDEETS
jgi:hypothetical protein